jgi:hypothetical protein
VQPIQGADHQPHIVEFATATDQNSHLPSPRAILNISINARARNARLRARSPLNSDVAALCNIAFDCDGVTVDAVRAARKGL